MNDVQWLFAGFGLALLDMLLMGAWDNRAHLRYAFSSLRLGSGR